MPAWIKAFREETRLGLVLGFGRVSTSVWVCTTLHYHVHYFFARRSYALARTHARTYALRAQARYATYAMWRIHGVFALFAWPSLYLCSLPYSASASSRWWGAQ
ncbi:uncharacterized protein K452DRAFT_286711 [Aplosporella prunicola CBS 121167]|uniref:Uncharacterized protein n=1 Tax=Aplosporella prunicola CBS 121167 TaxID=1176127 RepID=A0A6A6BHL4_9PEZI|nr:uncharacterized protein K452DRAFT_286711 [Aplosporella prunicola CBS 121167]KAF2143088.1 hypothetical protein K452DRAFT_286711 [Aplosporella prunicola CBS 121167]